MTSMTTALREVTPGTITAGVDTHGQTHHAALLDHLGRQLADREFPTTSAGYAALLAWASGHGQLGQVGVEGTGSYGAALARHLHSHDVSVIEVDRPDRKARRRQGKSDPLDAYAAARAVLSGRATGTPKSRDGRVEAIRALRVARRSAVKARTQAGNQLHALLTTGPAELREQLRAMSATKLIVACSRLRPTTDLSDPEQAVKTALRRLAHRHQHLSAEIKQADNELHALIQIAAPALLARLGVGTDVAGAMLITSGDNPDRLRSEAAFAHLCGTAPLPASSGRTDRHRLNRGGDRTANNALHTVVLCRLRHDPATQQYAARRTQQGLGKKEIIRCLKRYVAREIYHELRTTPTPTKDLATAA